LQGIPGFPASQDKGIVIGQLLRGRYYPKKENEQKQEETGVLPVKIFN
jgi:hypothetical protein